MRTPSLGLALCAGLGLSACATTHAVRTSDDRLAKDRPAAATACVDWRWIAITQSPGVDCPTPPSGWDPPKRLFQPDKRIGQGGYEQARKEGDSEQRSEGYGSGGAQPQPTPHPQQGLRTADVEQELARFCVYEPTSWKKPRRPPFASAEAAGLASLERDCAGISRAGTADLTAASIVDVAQYFFARAGAATTMEINNQQGVRLSFVDTQPTKEGVPTAPGRSKHGYTLAHIANTLVCSPQHPERCAAQITTRLATPMLSLDRGRRNARDFDFEMGGGFGTQGDLANAIYAEVNDWRAANAGLREPQRLILNLSLGWDPQLLGGLSEESIARMQAGTQAVYRALQYAKSLDVLVLAAAGNRRDCCPQTVGPLLPAAWEERHPTDERFRDVPQSPLLYAVGGVRSDGRPLANARDGGMPKRVAYGENGVVAAKGREGVTSTWLYTGSSVATAVVSATAALVWDTVPRLSSAEVMEVLEESGAAVPFAADFWFAGGTARPRGPLGLRAAAEALAAPEARQISVCNALLHACGRFGATCPVSECGDTERQRAVFPDWAAQPASTACHPWLVPQPEDPLCPACSPPYRP